MRRKVWRPPAPSVRAASSSSLPWLCMSGMSSRATNGDVTKRVDSTIPGSAKMILMSCSISQGPTSPCAPKRSTKIIPEMTGETLKGTSMSVVRRCLPRNSNFAIAHAAASPKIRFSGTAIAAVVSVRRIACRETGSPTAERYAAIPFSKAFANTSSKGTRRKSVRNPIATAIRQTRTARGSVRGSARSRAISARLHRDHAQREKVDGDQEGERHEQEDERDRRGAGVVELLEPDHDQKRRDLGLHGHVAGDEDDRSVLSERPREGEREAGEDRREELREQDAQERLRAAGPEARRRFLRGAVEVGEHGLDRPHHEGEAHEGQRHDDPDRRVGDR